MIKVLCVFLTLISLYPPLSTSADTEDLEPITVQLRWHHQFQFAGYYAAKSQGYYRDAGFDVTILNGSPTHQPVTEVLAGRAQFGVGNSEVILARLRGEPLQVLAATFQHSPSVLLSLKESNIHTPKDLIGKRMMSVGKEADTDLLAMLSATKVSPSQLIMQSSSYDINDLVRGKTDAFNSYISNEPFYLEERGIEYNVMKPIDYGIDFYNDLIFTTEQEIAKDPDRAIRFKNATLKGWEYALQHPTEIIHLIKRQYGSSKSLNHLRFEAIATNELIMPTMIELGHINPKRMHRMAELFMVQGSVDSLKNYQGFVFDPSEHLQANSESIYLWIVVAVLALAGCFVLLTYSKNLKSELKIHLKNEEQLHQQAYTDSLTRLLNRRVFDQQLVFAKEKLMRFDELFTLILMDIDHFKQINDKHGHEAGDQVLKKVSEVFTDMTRNTDYCARFGGEEFIILLPHTDLQSASKLAEKIRQHFENLTISLANGSPLQITASFGVAEANHNNIHLDVLSQADTALYKAKESGRNRVIEATPEQAA